MDLTLGKFKISGAALLALTAVYFFDFGGIALTAAAAFAVHELGHLAALRCFGNRLAIFRADIWGLTIRYEKAMSYTQEIVTAAAGPVSSLMAAFAASLLGRHTGGEGFYVFAGMNLVCGVFNLLPAARLDGGKLLYGAAALALGLEWAEKLITVTSCVVIGGLLVSGAALLIWTRVNFTLLLAAAWLLISYCKTNGIRIKSKRKKVGCV
jgi:Zn-dependent protease